MYASTSKGPGTECVNDAFCDKAATAAAAANDAAAAAGNGTEGGDGGLGLTLPSFRKSSSSSLSTGSETATETVVTTSESETMSGGIRSGAKGVCGNLRCGGR